MKNKVVFILGATGVGKSKFAIELAKKFGGEIISADSVQVFKGLDIGSAKISVKEMQDVVHHGIDIVDANARFSAHDFATYTKEKIKEIASRGALPIVVGGTGLYVKTLTEGLNLGGVENNQQLREQLESLAKEKGNDFLFEMLKKQDAELASQTDKHNPVRLVRALEIAMLQGQKSREEVEIQPLIIALERPREQLYEAINKRVDKFLQAGLVQEVRNLLKSGVSPQAQSLRAIGYQEVLEYLSGEIDIEQMTDKIKQHTRNYAKRQQTFLRTMKGVNFVDVSDEEKAMNELSVMVEEFLK